MADQMEKHRKELEALESDDENEEEAVTSVDATYDHPEHVVTVTTISDVNLDTEKFACIGPNRGLMETVKLQPDTSLSEKQNNNPPAKGIEKSKFKQQKTHKKFKRKRINKKTDQQQDGQSGKSKKRKQIHPHGKSKHFKKS
ncbi:rRNA binding [Desmophyllum pertusum]|uniref:rRNA binding n=1 Tax=Desmophyllum pertusum TaxID=174260 RepID=A0A9X0D0V6_9CNID|nr:rRNA binding [Desmophyllum pertusum]